MSPIVRDNLLDGYRRIADVECRPGMLCKQIDEIVRRAIGGDYPAWRIRAIRQGQGGCFSAAAYQRWMDAVAAWEQRHRTRAAAAAQTERARQVSLKRETLEKTRAEVLAHLARIELQLARVADDGGDPA